MSADRDVLGHAWWLASRSAGIVAYVLLSLAVVLGLAMALRLAPAPWRGALRLGHERIALLALGAIGAHGVLLLGDPWLRPALTQLVLPFSLSYRPVWTALGIVAFDLAAVLSLTYYARRRLGTRRWRTAHRFIPIAWALAALHVIGAGTDAGELWLQAVLAATIAAILSLLGWRLVMPPQRVPAPRPAAPVARPTPAASPSRPAPERLWT
jgi:methionine sulfoxide reductase heme-binding subunit